MANISLVQQYLAADVPEGWRKEFYQRLKLLRGAGLLPSIRAVGTGRVGDFTPRDGAVLLLGWLCGGPAYDVVERTQRVMALPRSSDLAKLPDGLHETDLRTAADALTATIALTMEGECEPIMDLACRWDGKHTWFFLTFRSGANWVYCDALSAPRTFSEAREISPKFFEALCNIISRTVPMVERA